MKKILKTEKKGMIATLFFVFVMLGVSISFMSLDKANAETAGSTSESISAAESTEKAIIIIPITNIQEITKPTEPTEPAPTQGETGDIKWVVNDNKQLIISKNNTGETCSTGDWYETYITYSTIYTIDGGSFEFPVKEERILDTPWSKCDYNSVIIEDGVTEIGDYSFYRAKFEEISLPDSLISIKRSALRCVETSDKFVFPPNLTEIGDQAFSNSGFDFDVATLPNSLTNLGYSVFTLCLELKSIDLSQTLIKEIKDYTFSNCRNLKMVKFPQQLESIGTKAFLNTNINEYIIPSKNIKIGYKPMGYYSPTGEPQTTKTKFIGYTGSTVAEYASQSDDFTFVPLDDGKGDLNFDGLINKLDVQILQEHLTNKSKMDDNAIERADILKDGYLNSFDVVKLKRIILEN